MTTHASESAASAPDTMNTELSVNGGLTILAVSGTIDMATAPVLQTAVREAVSSTSAGLIIDLSDVEFLASAGMTILVEARQRIGDSAAFAVVADGPATSRPLSLTGLDKALGLYATVAQAVAALGPEA
ncbi:MULTISPECIES: STAS domain-containing protein [Antrihabitans]|nr:STAS domain-containing protein [Antrihabitans stalagmiti]